MHNTNEKAAPRQATASNTNTRDGTPRRGKEQTPTPPPPLAFQGTPPPGDRPANAAGGKGRGGVPQARGDGSSLPKNSESVRSCLRPPEAHAAPVGTNGGGGTPGHGLQTDRVSGFDDPKIVFMLKQVSEDAPSKLGVFRRVYSATASPREAIRAKCLECAWMSVADIRECPSSACPLWGFRPYQQQGQA